jgi:hypothetical protein
VTRDGIVERKKRLARAAAERTIERIEAMRNALNVHPWHDGGELDPEEALAAFSAIVDDDQAQLELIENERRLWRLEPGRIPRRLFLEEQQMYQKYLEAGGPVRPGPVLENRDAS